VDALLEATGQLDEPLGTYCRRLRQLRHRAIRSKQLQDQAAADVVHDLKQPLSTIDLRIALMLDDAALSPTSRHSIERVRKQVHALLRQVEDLLDMHRWDDAGQVASVEMIDLAATVRELLESFDISAAARGVALETAIEVSAVAADRGLLSRMLAILLDNALQHAPKGSSVQITAARAADGRGVDLHVIDAGAGVPIELGQRIFERFVQAPGKGPAPARIHHGIGLAFCKAVAQAHAGHITVGRQNAKTVFTVHLPDGAACDCG
jgi:signal transduction histidine kinase